MAACTLRPKLLSVTWPAIAVFAFLANLPDIDFLLGIAISGNAHLFHSGPTHSLAFAFTAAMLITLFWQPTSYWRILPWILTAVLSHVVIDLFTGPALGFNRSYGVPLFWPLLDDKIRMPLTLFPGVEHTTLHDLVSIHNVKVMFIEIIIFAPLLFFLWQRIQHQKNITTPFRVKR